MIIGGEFAIDPNAKFDGKAEQTIAYSSGRAALYQILLACEKKIGQKGTIALPDYLCSSITQTVIDKGWNYIFYHINPELYPECYEQDCDAVLLINYFGMLNPEKVISKIRERFPNRLIILDNVQAYYEMQKDIGADYRFCSYRKWFPVPDGADIISIDDETITPEYLYQNTFAKYKFAGNVLKNFEKEVGSNIILKLLADGEETLDRNYLCNPYELSPRLISEVDVELTARKRRENASILHTELSKLDIPHVYSSDGVPLFVPIFVNNRDEVRRAMFAEEIFTPVHWPVVSSEINGNNTLYETELSLICDQRYGEEQMLKQIAVLKQCIY